MYPVVDPTIHSMDFLTPSDGNPNTVTIEVNFTVLTGSTMDIYSHIPTDLEIDAYFSDSLHPLSEAVRLPSTYQSIAKIRCSQGTFAGKYVSGIMQIDVFGEDSRIAELKKMVKLLLDGDPDPEVLL